MVFFLQQSLDNLYFNCLRQECLLSKPIAKLWIKPCNPALAIDNSLVCRKLLVVHFVV